MSIGTDHAPSFSSFPSLPGTPLLPLIQHCKLPGGPPNVFWCIYHWTGFWSLQYTTGIIETSTRSSLVDTIRLSIGPIQRVGYATRLEKTVSWQTSLCKCLPQKNQRIVLFSSSFVYFLFWNNCSSNVWPASEYFCHFSDV